MKALKSNFLFKLLFLLIFFAALFLISSFSSKSFAATCGPNGQNPTCPTGYTCSYTSGNPDFGGTCIATTPSTTTPPGQCTPSATCAIMGYTCGGFIDSCDNYQTCGPACSGTTTTVPSSTCGPNGQNPTCPTGYTCSYTSGNPDFGGTCIATTTTTTVPTCGPNGTAPLCPTGYTCSYTEGNPDLGGTCIATTTITFPVGSSATCITSGEHCVQGGVDANGQTCCSPLVCTGAYQGSTFETDCEAPQTAPAVFSCSGSSCSTALGDIPIDVGGFVNKLFAIILSISGGIAIILIIISGYKLMVSRGNPEQIQGAREQFTAAIVGLLFIILSLVILQVIGVDILKLPGFTS